MPTKAEITRQTILEAALTLIQKEGYEKANMRAIAESAGLSLGAAYYYFPGKDHIIQAYYEDNFARYLPLAEEIIEQGKDFAATYTEVLAALYRTAAPWHKVATPLFSAAAVPGSPLSPFSGPSDCSPGYSKKRRLKRPRYWNPICPCCCGCFIS